MKLITNETEQRKLLKETSRRCIEMMEELNIEIANNVYFTINKRGICRGLYTITGTIRYQRVSNNGRVHIRTSGGKESECVGRGNPG